MSPVYTPETGEGYGERVPCSPQATNAFHSMPKVSAAAHSILLRSILHSIS